MNLLDKIIHYIRENMVANAPGTSGGFSSSASAEGPVAGYDRFVGRRGKVDYRKVPKKYKDWVKNLDKNQNKSG